VPGSSATADASRQSLRYLLVFFMDRCVGFGFSHGK
jgi:hypothetical protein